jgi:(R,R)-butanediol dehydrogenase / meso-butanediol dehydrogenase / diacetyl reductase
VADPNPDRLEMARAFGATDTMAAALDAEQNGYDVSIECVGKAGLVNACIAATRAKGRIVVAGVCAEQDPFWSMAALMKELTIRFAVYYSPDEFRTVVGAFASSAIDPGRLVGRIEMLQELPAAFVALADGSVQGKILIDPSGEPLP